MATGLWLAAGGVWAQSVWDRPAPIAPPQQRVYQTAEYRVEEPAQPVDVWAGSRSAWTAVDAQGRDIHPAPIAVPQPAARPVVQTQPRPTFMPLPESVIRSSLPPAAPPVSAASLLRGTGVNAPSEAAPVGVARLVLTSPRGVAPAASSPPCDVPMTEVAYEAALLIEAAPPAELSNPPAEERTFSLFDPPAVVNGERLDDGFPTETSWQSVLAGLDDSDAHGLLAPNVTHEHHGRDAGDALILDGLDAVNGGEPARRDPYQPVPISQIRPYKSYTPEGIELCPSPDARCPVEKSPPGSLDSTERYFAHLDFVWVPANIFYSPLYFEDPHLERYGHSHGPLLQPLASSARFGAQLVSLPYQVALDPPHRRVYPLGFFRPGECAPKQVPNVPLNAKAGAAAGLFYTGMIFAFP